MHPQLSSSPLVYMLAQVKLTSIEKLEDFIPSLQERVRGTFPHYLPVSYQGIQFNQQGQLSHVNLKQWHFLDKGKQTGIVLDKQALTIHTSCYQQFQLIMDKFEKVLTSFHEIVKFSLFTRLGLRYINLIEEGLRDIGPGLQGFHLTGDLFKESQFLSKAETTQYSKVGMIKLQATHIGDKTVIGDLPNICIPPDLSELVKPLTFQNYHEPQDNFLLLDLDHFSEVEEDFDVNRIIESFSGLHEGVYQSFCQAVGDRNLDSWG